MPAPVNEGLAQELYDAALGALEKWARSSTHSSDPEERIRVWVILHLIQRSKDLEAFEGEIQKLMFPLLYVLETVLTPSEEDGDDPDNIDYVEQAKRAATSIVHSQNALAGRGAPLLDAFLTPEAMKVARAAGADGRGGSFSEEVLAHAKG